jgi:hypothetical protein
MAGAANASSSQGVAAGWEWWLRELYGYITGASHGVVDSCLALEQC